ncbi:Hypothetical protein FKW44_003249, partial [Caligus rogercresseyi]
RHTKKNPPGIARDIKYKILMHFSRQDCMRVKFPSDKDMRSSQEREIPKKPHEIKTLPILDIPKGISPIIIFILASTNYTLKE